MADETRRTTLIAKLFKMLSREIVRLCIIRLEKILHAILGSKTYADFFRFQHSSSLPQVKRNQLIFTRKRVYNLSRGLTNNLELRVFGNLELSRKSLKCLDLMESTQPDNQKANFDIFARKSPKISCKTFHTKTYSTQCCQFV